MMAKQIWKQGNMLYPVPAVLVSCADKEGHSNFLTIAWTGTVCSEPPMVSISVRPERYSYGLIKESKEFVINLTTEALVRKTDTAGVRSGRDTDKWEALHLTPEKASVVKCPMIKESPVNMECRVKKIIPLGSHDLFLAEVVAVNADSSCLDKNGRLDLYRAGLIAYSHGEYYTLGKLLGKFGFSVQNGRAEKSVRTEKSVRREKSAHAGKPVRGARPAQAEKPFHGAKPAHTEKLFHGVKSAHAEKPFREAKPAHAEKSFRGAKQAQAEKPFHGAKPARFGKSAHGRKPFSSSGMSHAGRSGQKTRHFTNGT
jgi:flavin reductase (DIM6/NTAB) family NADH-FMN oxidoreductase RutF